MLLLLHDEFQLTLIPNQASLLREKSWTRFMDRLGVRYALWRQLPKKLEGFALSLCNGRFLKGGMAQKAKERGLTTIWSSEMGWHHPGELEVIKKGCVDRVLYVSEVQKKFLHKGYGKLPSVITGNYIDPTYFPFRPRRNETFAIGRLSRPDPEKFPEDFPVFYEALELPDTRFRVMAWSQQMARKYRWHHFDDRWELLPALKESQLKFLYSLNLFVFPLRHTCTEVWGRSTVEAMLTGCIPLVPAGHHFAQLIVSGESGFICCDFLEYQGWAQKLYYDRAWRDKVAVKCSQHAIHELCDAEQHRRLWREVFQ
ncbi:MAG TPA: hypothetical protein VL361_11110 [Candidatus Limnocylindrales bacterium]|nr:hypothetical protein [Candidatus Limnocylindrales bacterium]